MGLQGSKVTKNIPKDAMLWRYMTLDKLINILSTQKLYFTPLHWYKNTDPYEGILPKVALEAIREIYLSEVQKKHLDQLIAFRNYILEKNTGLPEELAQLEKLDTTISKLNEYPEKLEKSSFRIFKSTLVNCWHQNEFESEAMWRLYSENNKGIAIQTTFQDLIDSINDKRIYLSEVRYINFHDENLKPSDCVVNGHISPLLKRKSFEHEKEVRLFFQPENDFKTLSSEEYEYRSQPISVDLSKLISKIYISPYASELFVSSVTEVLKRFEIEENRIVHSDLLNIDESLMKIF